MRQIMFQSLVWWIRGFKSGKIKRLDHAMYKFQSLVWWIRGFKTDDLEQLQADVQSFNPWFGG